MRAARQTIGDSSFRDRRAMAPRMSNDSGDRLSLGSTLDCVGEHAYAEHEHVFLDGGKRTHVYLVLTGVVGIYKLLCDGRRQISTFACPGDLIGLDCSDRHVDNAEVLAPARLRCIPVNAIARLIRDEPGFGQTLLHIVAEELAETRDRMLSLGRQTASERLAGFLLRATLRQACPEAPAAVVSIPMKRGEIADFLGLTVETVSRNFTRLRMAGVIRLRANSEVEITDRQRLESIALGDQWGRDSGTADGVVVPVDVAGVRRALKTA